MKNDHFLAVSLPTPEPLKQSSAWLHTGVPASLAQVETARRGTKVGSLSAARLPEPPSPQGFALSSAARPCGHFPCFLGVIRTLNGEEVGCFSSSKEKSNIWEGSELHCCSSSFPGGAGGKESACQCRRLKNCRFDPWRVPWRRAWQLIPVFLPGESHGQRRLGEYSP